MSTLLWLDDVRDPFDKKINWLVFSPIPTDELTEVVWVKSYGKFIEFITDNGVPDAICFDHDLADCHYAIAQDWEAYYNKEKDFKEYTGYDCAKWLIDYCMKYKCPLPKWNSQSANPIGKDNINGLLNNYLKKCEQI